MKSMKKKAKKALVLAVLGSLGYMLVKLLRTEAAQDKLFEILGEDKYLTILNTVNLVGDLLSWPINFVKALLP